MGTIVERERRDKSIGYTAIIRLKRGGRVVHTETKTFDRRPAAANWIKKRERDLAQPGALDAAQKKDPSLSDVIDQYIKESRKDIGRTKAQVLRAIKAAPIGGMECSKIDSAAITRFAQGLGVQPQTVGNYLAHLASIFAIARPAWGYPLDQTAMDDARKVAKKLGVTSRSIARNRRPTMAELDLLMDHFGKIRAKRVDSTPMQAITAFAIYSTRRLEEMCRITWKDLDEVGSRVMVRDLKHPGEKIGNDVWCDLPPEAMRIIQAQPKRGDRIFPVSSDAVSAAFTRAAKFLEIEDLHLHDMRHEGASRLFEMGLSIPRVAAVTGHRSWQSLKRYTHLRHDGDRFADWKWLDVVAPPEASAED